MSFLALDDDRAALEEALRFIDEFALPDDLGEPPAEAAQPPDVRKRPKRVRDPAVYVRRRNKQKNELLQLREQCKQLERQLHSSRRALGFPAPPSPPPSSDSDGGTTSESSASSTISSSSSNNNNRRKAKRHAAVWLAVAMREQRRRQSAEHVNSRLRAELTAQSLVGWSLAGFASQYSAPLAMEIELQLNQFQLYTRAVSMGPEPPVVANAGTVSELMAQLHTTSQRLMEEANAAFDASAVDAVTSEQNVKYDPVIGMYAETRNEAPLRVGLDDLSAYTDRNLWPVVFPPHLSQRHGDKLVTRDKYDVVDMALQGTRMRFAGVSMLHKRVEADRVVFTFTSVFFHASGQLSFREGGWFLILRSPANPAGASVFRGRCRIAGTIFDGASALDGLDVGQVHSLALAALGHASKSKHQNVQRMLLLASGSAELAAAIPEVDLTSGPAAIHRDSRHESE